GVERDPSIGRLVTEDAGERRRDADRPAAVRPDRERGQTRGDRGGRAAARAARRLLAVPGIAGGAEDEVMRRADPPERRLVRLSEPDAAGRGPARPGRRVP